MNENYFIICAQIIVYWLKDIFYFNVCSYCKKSIENRDKQYFLLCNICIDSISYLSPVKHKKTDFLVYALGKYDGVLRYVVTEKYRKRSIGYYVLEKKIIEMLDVFNIQFDYVLPVPKTAINTLKHQLNQTAIIAEIITKHYKKIIFNDIYTKENKQDQAGKRFSERIMMHNDIFFVPESKKLLLSRKKILIIDDVYTTGMTIDAVLHAVSKIDYESIVILVLARK